MILGWNFSAAKAMTKIPRLSLKVQHKENEMKMGRKKWPNGLDVRHSIAAA